MNDLQRPGMAYMSTYSLIKEGQWKETHQCCTQWKQDTIVHPLHSDSQTQRAFLRKLQNWICVNLPHSLPQKAASTLHLSWKNKLQLSCACPGRMDARLHTSAQVDIDLSDSWATLGHFLYSSCSHLILFSPPESWAHVPFS